MQMIMASMMYKVYVVRVQGDGRIVHVLIREEFTVMAYAVIGFDYRLPASCADIEALPVDTLLPDDVRKTYPFFGLVEGIQCIHIS